MKIENPYIQYMYSYPHKTAYKSLCGVSLSDYVDQLSGRENSLYLHIPFCQSKCGYCNLFSVAGQEGKILSDYVDTIERQAKQLGEILPSDVHFQDFTLGGGTPLLLPESLLRRVFEIVRTYLGLDSLKCPVVIETSPNQTTKEKLHILKEEGVNRVSIGVQSFQPQELKTLQRFHCVETAKQALFFLKEMEFDCVNIDLIYGIPGQTIESLKDSLNQALAYEPEELFVYPLYVKPGTSMEKKGFKHSPDTFSMYCFVREYLKQEGYQPQSMRRFVRKKPVSRADAAGAGMTWLSGLPEGHCGFGNTISLGCGGRSYFGNLHFCTPYSVRQEDCLVTINKYIKQTDFLQVPHGFLLSEEEQRRRYAIRHILFGKGVNRKEYRETFGTDVVCDFEQIRLWEQEGYAVVGDSFVGLTEEGFGWSDYLGPQLISPEVKADMEAFYRQSF